MSNNTEGVKSITEGLFGRRSWLAGLIAAVTGIVVPKKASGAAYPSERIYREHGFHLLERFRPAYVPSGYLLVGVYSGRPDGFRGMDRERELAIWYKNTATRDYLHNPLAVYVRPLPADRFARTLPELAQSVSVTRDDGERIEALYYDGQWVRDKKGTLMLGRWSGSWSQANMHSVVFETGGHAVAVRGSRVAGVSLDELLKVAASLPTLNTPHSLDKAQ